MRGPKPRPLPRVVVGQIWRDNKARRVDEGDVRFLKVVDIIRPQFSPYSDEMTVFCYVGYLDDYGIWHRDGNRRTQVQISRMRTASVYVLVQDVEATP